MGSPDRLRAGRREAAFWVGLASLFVLTTAVVLVGWAVVPGWLPGWDASVVTSGSMAPRIRTGDVVVWNELKADEIGDGTVVVFDDGLGSRVVHRVIGREEDGSLRTRGDANPEPDSSPVPPPMVHGAGRVLVPLVGLPRVWMVEGRWWRVLAVTVVLVAAAAASRLTWSAEFDPWLAAAEGGSVSHAAGSPAGRPLWLAPLPVPARVGASGEPSPSLLPPGSRELLVPSEPGAPAPDHPSTETGAS